MSSSRARLGRLVFLLGIVLAAVIARLGPRDHLLQPQGLLIHDLDTLRRLARLEAIDRAGAYPIVEKLDGYPNGTMLHWTLPMDWVIRALDPLASWAFAQERGYEAGAVVAGPLLAVVALLLFVALATRLIGAWPARVAGLLYALAHSCVATSSLGNGDHQTLQQAAAVVAVLGLLIALREGEREGTQGGTRRGSVAWAAVAWAGVAGGALGFAIWVSTELMLLFYVLGLALVVLAAWEGRDGVRPAAAARLLLPWSLGVWAMTLAGHAAEQREDPLALRWDTVSLFQVWQVGVFALFAAALRVGAGTGVVRVLLRGVAALACGSLPFVFPGVRDALSAQLRDASEVNVWLAREVSEFRGLFSTGFDTLRRRDGEPVFLLPFALLALRWSPLGGRAGLALGLTALGTFGLYVWEVKLGHLFALLSPLALVAGWQGAARRVAPLQTKGVQVVLGGLAGLVAWTHLPGPRAGVLRTNDLTTREICAKVAALAKDQDASVLAPWDMGAPLLYFAGAGVVASGYHRNLEGIRDGFRFWLTDIDQKDAAMDILRARRVRWVVAWYSLTFLTSGAETLGKEPLLTARGIVPAAARTMFWKLRYESLPGFRVLAEGPQIRRRPSDPPEPLYRLYEVVP